MADFSVKLDFLRRREFLLAVAAVLLLLVAGRAGWSAYQSRLASLDEEIALKKLQYEKFSRLVARQQEFVALDQALTRFSADIQQKRLIQGETPTLTEVQFQNLMQMLARDSAVDVRSTKVLPPLTKDGVTVLRLRLSCRAEITAIRDFLLQVNNREKLIFIQEMEIKNISRREKRFYYLNAVVGALTL